jgi:hypothetical protein
MCRRRFAWDDGSVGGGRIVVGRFGRMNYEKTIVVVGLMIAGFVVGGVETSRVRSRGWRSRGRRMRRWRVRT